MSYGNGLSDSFRRAATHADRILKGATPSELPVTRVCLPTIPSAKWLPVRGYATFSVR